MEGTKTRDRRRWWAACLAGWGLWWGAADAPAAGLLHPKNQPDAGAKIKSQAVDVTLNNGFARTEVDQVFANPRDADIEAIYTFPLPKQASLSEVSLWIDGKEVVGEVVERKQAREIYEQQVAKGHDTALAEKNNFKTFDISVGRLRAGQDTRVRIVYSQPVEIDLNDGRYVYPLAEGNTDDDRIPFWSVDDQVSAGFRFHLTLKSAFPVRELRAPGFEQAARIARAGATNEAEEVYTVDLDQAEGAALNRDIVVYYRLADDVPARVELVPYREAGKPGTFMLVVTPAADLRRIAEGTDWIFVLDTSGSMQGGKLTRLADGVNRVLGKMSPQDRFRIVTFSDSAFDLTGGPLAATPENVQQWIGRVSSLQANGGTALFAGLEKAYHGLEADRTTGIILVTDGVCNIGPTEHAAFLKLCRGYDIRLFTFVIGNSANQPLMEALALETQGFAMNLSESDDIVGRLIQAKAKILYECLHDVKVSFSGEKVHDLTPARPGSLYQGQQLVQFGRYDGDGPVEVSLSARVSGQERTWKIRANLPAVDGDNPELERLWACSRIDELMQQIRDQGESESLRAQVTALGVDYSLVTDYTSMVVLRDEEAETLGLQRRNQQRVSVERAAQQQRAAAPVVHHRVDQGQGPDGGGAFGHRSAPGIGTGPVGPLFLVAAGWLARRRRAEAAAHRTEA